jgi:hypothetical protein
MAFLERVILQRRCLLEIAHGLPSLRSMTFGRVQPASGLGA